MQPADRTMSVSTWSFISNELSPQLSTNQEKTAKRIIGTPQDQGIKNCADCIQSAIRGTTPRECSAMSGTVTRHR